MLARPRHRDHRLRAAIGGALRRAARGRELGAAKLGLSAPPTL